MGWSIFRDDENTRIFCDDPRHAAENFELGALHVYLRYVDVLRRRQLIVELNHLDFNGRFDTGEGGKGIMTGDRADIERFCRVLRAPRRTPRRNAVVKRIEFQRMT